MNIPATVCSQAPHPQAAQLGQAAIREPQEEN